MSLKVSSAEYTVEKTNMSMRVRQMESALTDLCSQLDTACTEGVVKGNVATNLARATETVKTLKSMANSIRSDYNTACTTFVSSIEAEASSIDW